MQSSTNASTYGGTILFTATLAGFSGTPDGNIAVCADASGGSCTGAVTLCSGIVNNSGVAYCSSTALGAGSHSITAVYSGDANNAGTSTTRTTPALVVDKRPLRIVANPRDKTYGQLVTFAGTEFGVSGLQNNETVGSATLASDGAAAGARVNGNPGTYLITIANATGGTFNAANYSISYSNGVLTVWPLAIRVSANAASKMYGQADPAFTYTIAPALVAGDTFNGRLSRYRGETVGTYEIYFTSLDLGEAQWSYVVQPVSANLTITTAPTSTSMVSSAASGSVFGEPVMLSATVVPAVGGATLTGSVTFCDGATSPSDASCDGGAVLCPAVALVAGADTAICAVPNFSVGTHALSAVYSGDDNNLASSATFVQSVKAQSTTLLSTACPTPFVEHQSIRLDATVHGSSPSGDVTFGDGAGTYCEHVPLNAGSAACATPPLGVPEGEAFRLYDVIASYAGDDANMTSASRLLTLTVLSAGEAIFHDGFDTASEGCPER